MNLTTAQVFQIGGIIIGLVTALLPLFGFDPKIIATAGGAIASAWAAIGTTLTGAAAQTRAVAGNIDNPEVKTTIVKAVAGLRGVENIGINRDADAALAQLAADNSQPKILPPK